MGQGLGHLDRPGFPSMTVLKGDKATACVTAKLVIALTLPVALHTVQFVSSEQT